MILIIYFSYLHLQEHLSFTTNMYARNFKTLVFPKFQHQILILLKIWIFHKYRTSGNIDILKRLYSEIMYVFKQMYICRDKGRDVWVCLSVFMSILIIQSCMSMYLWIEPDMHVCMYECMHICMYICRHTCMSLYIWMCKSMFYVCMYACMYVCMYADMNKYLFYYLYSVCM